MLFISMVLIWLFLTGDISFGNLGVGAVISFLILSVIGNQMNHSLFRTLPSPADGSYSSLRYLKYVGALFLFVLFFLKELLKAGVQVFRTVSGLGEPLSPGVVAVPLGDLRRGSEIAMLANLVTLIPGTLSIDVSTDQRVIYIHTMYMESPEQFRKEIQDHYATWIKRVMNP